MSLKHKDDLIADLEELPDLEDVYAYIIDKAKDSAGLTDEQKQEKYRITGCMSQLWLYPELKDGLIYFAVDSDAMIPKGIAQILADVYSEMTPDEVLGLAPEFLQEYGIDQHLSMNRRNGLAHICKQIKLYALVYKSTLK